MHTAPLSRHLYYRASAASAPVALVFYHRDEGREEVVHSVMLGLQALDVYLSQRAAVSSIDTNAALLSCLGAVVERIRGGGAAAYS